MRSNTNSSQSFKYLLDRAIDKVDRYYRNNNQKEPAKKPLTTHVQFYIVHTT